MPCGIGPRLLTSLVALFISATISTSCSSGDEGVDTQIFAPMGEAMPWISDSERARFNAGKEVFLKGFTPEEGLGTDFNLTSCLNCHEKPVAGGSAGRYRNFLLVAHRDTNGDFEFLGKGGIARHFSLDEMGRVPTQAEVTIMATRNPIPMFGTGLISQIYDEAILKHADPLDEDGDGISGRPNFAAAVSGGGRILARFGRKAQVSSIESFIRAPLLNHMGITTLPLPVSIRRNLPIPLFTGDTISFLMPEVFDVLFPNLYAQGGIPLASDVLNDGDGVRDPEMGAQALADLIAFSLLLAVPKPELRNAAAEAGKKRFEDLGCSGCHVPHLDSPRGKIPLYSDLLLHDMGDDLADGIEMEDALGNEFRTQPLWGIMAVGPYLHDGRADTLEEAILWHGGEAQASRNRYRDLSQKDRGELLAFLESLGGRDQRSEGLLPPQSPLPKTGEAGGPWRELNALDTEKFRAGRAFFDRDAFLSEGLGSSFNGDSCRACHFLPSIGGAGPLDVNVIRQGIVDDLGQVSLPPEGSMLRRIHRHSDQRPEPSANANLFEHRQTPSLFGLGLVDKIDDATLLALADPDDENADGIFGRVNWVNGKVGKFGWKADIPSLEEFARDALSEEMGLTLPPQSGLFFGTLTDDDDVDDPEVALADIENLVFYMQALAPPQRKKTLSASEIEGETLFRTVGCDNCHIPFITNGDGVKVYAYSNFLLHDIAPPDFKGVPAAEASGREFRTAPLWGISQTGPYMHDGRSSTLEDAILRHHGEADTTRGNYEALTPNQKNALLDFLNAL